MSSRGDTVSFQTDDRSAEPASAGHGLLDGAASAARARWPEWRAALVWILHSWARPADADARWEQGRG